MKNLMNQSIILKYSFFLSLSLAAIIIVSQLIMAFINHQLTVAETIFINILVFVLSIAFSGIFTYFGAVHSFKQSQKEFAFSAFRRIKEIEAAAITLEDAVLRMEKTQQYDPNSLKIITLFLQRTIKSSIDDWGQVIGEELKTLNMIGIKEAELMEMENYKNQILLNVEEENVKTDVINEEILEIKEQINLLKNKLPHNFAQLLSDEQIEKMRAKIMIPIAVLPEKRLQLQEKFISALNTEPVKLHIKVNQKYFDEFVNIKPNMYLINEELSLRKDEKGCYYFENERGQKTVISKTGYTPYKIREHINIFLVNNNFTIGEIKAIVTDWKPNELFGEVILKKIG